VRAVAVAVTFYDVVLWVHVSAVVVGFGPTFAYGIWIGIAASQEPRSVPFVLRVTQSIDKTFVTVGATLILLSGLYLVSDRWDFGYFFVTWGIVAVLVLLGLTHGFFRPNEARAEELARRDVEASPGSEVKFSDEFNALSAKMARIGPIAGLIVILTMYVMTAKPFL
jgi:hypothetical protein